MPKRPSTFDEIYHTYFQRSFLFAKSYLQDDDAAKDAASEAMITLWKTMKEQSVDNVKAFLITIIRNYCLNVLRHEKLRLQVEEHLQNHRMYELEFRISSLQACNPSDLYSEEILSLLHRTLESFPEQTRRIFLMSRYENKPVKEIAAEMNISVKGVDYHISKALKELRVVLKDYLPFLLF